VANGFHHMMAGRVLGTCLACGAFLIDAPGSDAVSTLAEQSFQQIQGRSDHRGLTTSNDRESGHSADDVGYSPDLYVIGKGQGDMAKGAMVCQRVSELSARTDLAKQIRVLGKEHMIDRIRERSGRDTDQDIELTREEIVQEYLQGVKIIDHRIDETKNICSATAVMPKRRLEQLQPDFVPRESAPVTTR
jgi:hypothetical protein